MLVYYGLSVWVYLVSNAIHAIILISVTVISLRIPK